MVSVKVDEQDGACALLSYIPYAASQARVLQSVSTASIQRDDMASHPVSPTPPLLGDRQLLLRWPGAEWLRASQIEGEGQESEGWLDGWRSVKAFLVPAEREDSAGILGPSAALVDGAGESILELDYRSTFDEARTLARASGCLVWLVTDGRLEGLDVSTEVAKPVWEQPLLIRPLVSLSGVKRGGPTSLAINGLMDLVVGDRGRAGRRIHEFHLRFRQYSFRNRLFLAWQRPDATFVASASDWKVRHERKVKDDEKPLLITAPSGGTMFWPNAPVYDVSQTEGDKRFEPPTFPSPTASEAARRLCQDLEVWIGESGLVLRTGSHRVNTGAEASTDGYRVFVSPHLDDGARAAALAHEIGHIQLHFHGRRTGLHVGDVIDCDGAREKRLMELEAELVAFLILAERGIDHSGGAAAYMADWNAPPYEVAKAFPRSYEAAGRVLEDCRLGRYRQLVTAEELAAIGTLDSIF